MALRGLRQGVRNVMRIGVTGTMMQVRSGSRAIAAVALPRRAPGGARREATALRCRRAGESPSCATA
jgi:hypothetical protein